MSEDYNFQHKHCKLFTCIYKVYVQNNGKTMEHSIIHSPKSNICFGIAILCFFLPSHYHIILVENAFLFRFFVKKNTKKQTNNNTKMEKKVYTSRVLNVDLKGKKSGNAEICSHKTIFLLKNIKIYVKKIVINQK